MQELVISKNQRFDRNSFYNISELFRQDDPLYEIKCELLFFAAHLLHIRNCNLLGHYEFSLGDFSDYSKRRTSSLYLSQKNISTTETVMLNEQSYEVVNTLELALIELSQTAIKTEKFFKFGEKSIVEFGVTSLFTLSIDFSPTRKNQRLYGLKFNPCFVDGVLNQYMTLNPQRWFQIRAKKTISYPLLHRLTQFSYKTNTAKSNTHDFVISYSDMCGLTQIKIEAYDQNENKYRTIKKIKERLDKISEIGAFSFTYSIDKSNLSFKFTFYKQVLHLEGEDLISLVLSSLRSVSISYAQHHGFQSFQEVYDLEAEKKKEIVSKLIFEIIIPVIRNVYIANDYIQPAVDDFLLNRFGSGNWYTKFRAKILN
jgi:hypothetical protein